MFANYTKYIIALIAIINFFIKIHSFFRKIATKSVMFYVNKCSQAQGGTTCVPYACMCWLQPNDWH